MLPNTWRYIILVPLLGYKGKYSFDFFYETIKQYLIGIHCLPFLLKCEIINLAVKFYIHACTFNCLVAK
jgi:hypothetical protein